MNAEPGKHPPPAPEHRLSAVLFDRDLQGHPVELAKLGERAFEDDQLLWIDVLGKSDELPEAVSRYGIERDHLQPRDIGVITNVGDWSYLYARALNSAAGRKLVGESLVVAIGHNVVITAHHRPIGFLTAVIENEAEQLHVGSLQAGSFAASLLDRMLTDYLDARDEFESAVDRIELLVLRRPQSKHLSELQQLRRHASKLRRYLAMQRDMFDAVARPDFDPGQTQLVARHWQLLSARYSKVMMSVESARELVNGSFEVYTSRVAHRTSETMRLLTVVTVVLGSLAVTAGVLGMNFKAEVFESGDTGFWWAIGGMLAFAVLAIAVGIKLLTRR
jgi:magnesium transporter